jgi:hypothetical protein
MSYAVHLTPKSANAKTGPIPVSTTSAVTCPTACPFRKVSDGGMGGCYAASGPLALHWGKVTAGERGTDWATFVAAVAAMPAGTLWRHNQAGDLPGDGATIDADALRALTEANAGRRGFTYTHYSVAGDATPGWPLRGNAKAVRDANRAGFTVNLSANHLMHADQLAILGIGPVVAVLPMDVNGAETKTLRTPAGRTVVVCPATYRDDVSCATCQLCQRADRSTIVGFPAHGTGAKRASAVAGPVIRIAAA